MALIQRPPVVTIMGHVDHGKTTLLDYIRHAKVAAGEAGGITQHIGAYQADFKGKKITFIDTPGHAAFNKMRERGAKITDFVVLVVAANDGVKPQTIESIRYIKAAGVPVIVAINKIDLPDVYPDVAKSQLVEHGINVQGYGGDVEVVELSAKTGQGVDKLLETILVMAELQDLKADPAAPLRAIVIESSKDAQRGSVATVIVKQGTLSVRQDVEVEGVMGRVRRLSDEHGQSLDQVLPGEPAEIIGLAQVAAVGGTLHEQGVVLPPEEMEAKTGPSEDELLAAQLAHLQANLDETPRLKLIIKADVQGTLEAILATLDSESVELIDSAVGEVSEKDIDLAKTAGATILVFHTRVSSRIKNLAKQNLVRIKVYDVIYKLIEDLQKQMLRLMDSTIDEVVTGEAEIAQIFEMRGEKIAGCKVKSGEIKKHDLFHLKRGDDIIANPVIKSLMHGKQEIESTKGEFGATFKNKKLEFKVGDVLVAYKTDAEVEEL